jgi:dCMP deaminase
MVRTKPSKLQVAMMNAENTAQLSHDTETQVGSVLLHSTTMSVVATGYNGFIRKAPDNKLPNTRPNKYQYIIHSEENLLMNCVRNGISTDNCLVVCTMSPCSHCMRLLWQAGITKVICKNKYRDFNDITKMDDIGIRESITPEGFFLLEYEVKT